MGIRIGMSTMRWERSQCEMARVVCVPTARCVSLLPDRPNDLRQALRPPPGTYDFLLRRTVWDKQAGTEGRTERRLAIIYSRAIWRLLTNYNCGSNAFLMEERVEKKYAWVRAMLVTAKLAILLRLSLQGERLFFCIGRFFYRHPLDETRRDGQTEGRLVIIYIYVYITTNIIYRPI
jgi:hypothetical protein